MYSSLAFGVAGVAYAHWYGFSVLGRRHLLEEAERFIHVALVRQGSPRAFLAPPDSENHTMPPGAVAFGRAGLSFVRALIAHSADDHRARRRAVDRFAGLVVTPSSHGTYELYRGLAGGLAGAAILFDRLGNARLEELGNVLSRRLLEAAIPSSDGTLTWPPMPDRGLAHGAAGAVLALLLWFQAIAAEPPPRLVDGLESFFAAAYDEPRLRDDSHLQPKLCGGDAGLAVVAAKAFEVMGEEVYLDQARRSLRRALAAPASRHPHLCCGRLGLASACLAVHRHDPGGPWRQRAEELVLSTLLIDLDQGPVGLLNGEAAFPCLALDLLHERSSGPPGFDLVTDLKTDSSRRPKTRG